jgi:hypothetical protein
MTVSWAVFPQVSWSDLLPLLLELCKGIHSKKKKKEFSLVSFDPSSPLSFGGRPLFAPAVAGVEASLDFVAPDGFLPRGFSTAAPVVVASAAGLRALFAAPPLVALDLRFLGAIFFSSFDQFTYLFSMRIRKSRKEKSTTINLD